MLAVAQHSRRQTRRSILVEAYPRPSCAMLQRVRPSFCRRTPQEDFCCEVRDEAKAQSPLLSEHSLGNVSTPHSGANVHLAVGWYTSRPSWLAFASVTTTPPDRPETQSLQED